MGGGGGRGVFGDKAVVFPGAVQVVGAGAGVKIGAAFKKSGDIDVLLGIQGDDRAFLAASEPKTLVPSQDPMTKTFPSGAIAMLRVSWNPVPPACCTQSKC